LFSSVFYEVFTIVASLSKLQVTRMQDFAKANRLLNIKEVPTWQQDNKFILEGYRPLSNSYSRSLQSLLYLHNQTVNVYTHLLGLFLFTILAYMFHHDLYARYTTATHEDTIVFSAYFAGVFACFSLSSAYHTFHNHSKNIYEQWLVLDFLGILCLIAGSWVPGVYYGFYCQRTVSRFYLVLVRQNLLIIMFANIFLDNLTFSHMRSYLPGSSMPYTRMETFPHRDVSFPGCFRVLSHDVRSYRVWDQASA
jgi:predicted membrane channel-forming protein YqfA (hemolysin III family)